MRISDWSSDVCSSDLAAHLDRGEALAAPFVDEQLRHVILVVAFDRRKLQRRLEQRVQDMKARLVRGKPGALLLHPAERPHRDRAVGQIGTASCRESGCQYG